MSRWQYYEFLTGPMKCNTFKWLKLELHNAILVRRKIKHKLFKTMMIVLMLFMSIQGGLFIARPDHTVKAQGGTNLAFGKVATASSVQNVNIASRVTDGLTSTAWSSTFAEPAWIYVDLGSPQAIEQVILIWESAYGLEYKIEGSDTATTWTTLAEELHGDGGTDYLSVNGTWRYIRMYGTQRGTGWGFSILEFQIFDIAQTVPPTEPYIPSLPSKPASQVLFSDDLSSGNIDQWQVGRGTWQVSNGALTSSFPCAGGSPYTIAAGNTTWTDYQLTVDLQRLAGYDPGGILIRNSASGYYRVEILPSLPYGGAVRIVKSTTGASVQRSWPFNANILYRVLIDVEGPTIDVYVVDAEQNAKLMLSYTDTNAPFLTGNIGFFMAAGAVCPTQMAFDNIYVRQIVPSYLVSGVVETSNGDPISEVQVSANGLGISTITKLNGSYTLGRFVPGTYTITPTKSEYTFSPVSRTVNMPSNKTGQDFVAVPGGDPPVPFLDLPFDYGDTTSGFFQVLQNWSSDGQITSWFDHHYPLSSNWNKGDGLWLYKGDPLTENPRKVPPSVLCYGDYCYDGHNGYDLVAKSSNQTEIHPAASGNVVKVKSGCVKGNFKDGCGGYGNYVVIYHSEHGYFTLYGHLLSVSTGNVPVFRSDIIGTMGSTGNSGATHLHFGVYKDNGNNQWDGEGIDKPVDPFRWRGNGIDPWVADLEGPPSYGLWLHDPDQGLSFSGSQGATMNDSSGMITAIIPPDVFAGQVTMQLSNVPVAGSSAQLRSTGQSFLLQLLEGILGNRNPQFAVAQQNTVEASLAAPITFSVSYRDASVKHLNTTLLSLYHWNEVQSIWEPLHTTVDTANQLVTAETQELGDFDLQAPLLCPADEQEPDDNYFAGSPISTDGTSVSSLFDIAEDEDWFPVDAVAGNNYTIKTANLSTGVDTIVELYDTDGTTLLASDDDSGGGKASSLSWKAPLSGTYFIRVKQAVGSTFGCSSLYSINVSSSVIPTFSDVSNSYWAWNFVERLYAAGVTGGCSTNPLKYCPGSVVTRAQMAVFLLKAEHGPGYVPPAATGVFEDVAATDWTAPWIEQLATEGITGGCSVTPKRYCPTATITRAQMAVFLLRAEHGSTYKPPDATGTFLDVPKTDFTAPFIEQLANEQITGGCGGGKFCPANSVTRDQMAVFLVRAFNLP